MDNIFEKKKIIFWRFEKSTLVFSSNFGDFGDFYASERRLEVAAGPDGAAERPGVPPMDSPRGKNSPDSSVSGADKKYLKILRQESEKQGNESISKTTSKNPQFCFTILLIQDIPGLQLPGANHLYFRSEQFSTKNIEYWRSYGPKYYFILLILGTWIQCISLG